MTASYVHAISSSVPTIVAVTVEIACKAAVLCCIVWIAHLLTGRNRVLLRSVLWNLCVVGLLVLPVTVIVFPRMHVATWIVDTQRESTSPALTDQELHHGSEGGDYLALIEGPDSFAVDRPLGRRVNDAEAKTAENGAGDDSAMPDVSMTYLPLGDITVFVAVAAYFLVLATLIIRLGASLFAVNSLRHRSISVADPAWINALDRWQSQLGLRPAVTLLQTDSVSVPIVVGWRHPGIFIPIGLAREADRQTIDAVLLHELTHVQRGDYPWNLLLQLVRAIYWPHPCVWLVGRVVRAIREEVCDAVCAHQMGDVHAYCRILVRVATGLVQRSEVALGLAMTRSSRLSLRVSRIERSRGLPRSLLAKPARLTVAVVVIASAILLGRVHLVARAAVEGESREKAEFAAGQRDSALESRQVAVQERADDEPNSADRLQPVSATEKTAETPAGEPKPLRVQAVKLKRRTLEKTRVQPAILEAFGQVSIHPQHAGIVSKVLVDVGDRVKVGEALAEFNVPDIGTKIAEKEAILITAEADLERAKLGVTAAEAGVQSHVAALAEAEIESARAVASEKFRRKQYDRIKELVALKSVDERLLDEKEEQFHNAEAETRFAAAKIGSARAGVELSKVEVQVAQASLQSVVTRVSAAQSDLKRIQSKTDDAFRLIRSPIDGVVSEKTIEPGNSIQPGDNEPLLKLADTKQITAVVMIPDRDALSVGRGDPAFVRLDALGKRPPVAGKVTRVAYSVNRETRTLRTEISLPNSDGRLKPGMFGMATIVIGEIPDGLSIARSALTDFTSNGNETEATCVKVVNGRTARTSVTLGWNSGLWVEILAGLAEGDVVVVYSREELPDGQPVEVSPPRTEDE